MAIALTVDVFLDPCCSRSWSLLAAIEGLFEGATLRFRQLPLSEDPTGACTPPSEAEWARAPAAHALPVARAAKAVAALGGGVAEAQFLLALSPQLLERGAAGATRDMLLEAARVAGVDPVAFALALGTPELDAQIRQDLAFARGLGLMAVPAVQIRGAQGDRVLIEGAHDPSLYRAAIAALREEQARGLRATPIMPEIAQIMPDEAPTG